MGAAAVRDGGADGVVAGRTAGGALGAATRGMVGGGGGGTGCAVAVLSAAGAAGAEAAGAAATAGAGGAGAAGAAAGGGVAGAGGTGGGAEGGTGGGAAAAAGGGAGTGGGDAGRAGAAAAGGGGAAAWAGSFGCRSSSVYLAFSRSAIRPWVRLWRSAGVLARVGRAGTLARFGAALAWASAIFGSVGLGLAGVDEEKTPLAERYHSTGLTASGTDEQPPSAKTTTIAGPYDRNDAIPPLLPALPISDERSVWGDLAAGIV